jgi:rhamnosyltransferase
VTEPADAHQPARQSEPAAVAAVVITYQPEIDATTALLRALAAQVGTVVVVDNGSDPTTVTTLAEAVGAVRGDLIRLPENTGIAAAQNVGIARAREVGAAFVLLSDQDSVPSDDMVERLLAGYAAAVAAGRPVGAVGPVIIDERMPGAALLFASRLWGPRRAVMPTDGAPIVPATFLLASGCLVPVEVLDQVGDMNAPWFIDHIDLEWGLRARRAGYELYGVPGALLRHHLGDRLVSIPGRERDVHIHSPERNYYMARNTVLLIRSGLLPVAWRWGYAAWITKYAVFYMLTMQPRRQRLRLILRGLHHGVLGRTGPIDRDDRPPTLNR